MKVIDARNKRVLVIPDLHIPFEHPDSLKFVSAVYNDLALKDGTRPEDVIVINLGDEIDGHTISFHKNDPDIPYSPGKELEKAIEHIEDWYRQFPHKILLESNHGSLVYRRAKDQGIPLHYIKSYQEILNTPTWEWHEDVLLKTKMGDIYLCHGKTSATGKLSKEMGTYGAIQGHFHGKFQVTWSTTATGTRFDAFSGCLIDRQSLAFAYGKNHIPKPILGCLLISKMGYPQMIKMVTDDRDRWIWELP